MNKPPSSNDDKDKKPAQQCLRLSDLTVNVVLDHAGGHDTTVVRQEPRFRRSSMPANLDILWQPPSPLSSYHHPTNNDNISNDKCSAKWETMQDKITTNSFPRLVEPSPFPQQQQEALGRRDNRAEKIKVSPIRKRNKKLYISLKNEHPSKSVLPLTAPSSPLIKQARKSPKEDGASSTDATSPRPVSPRRAHRRQEAPHFSIATRRNSTGSNISVVANPISPRPTTPVEASPLITTTPKAYPRSESLATLRRQSSLDTDSTTTATPPANIDKASYIPAKLLDSPRGTSRRVPRGYQPLDPDLCSDTSCSTTTSASTEHQLQRRHERINHSPPRATKPSAFSLTRTLTDKIMFK